MFGFTSANTIDSAANALEMEQEQGNLQANSLKNKFTARKLTKGQTMGAGHTDANRLTTSTGALTALQAEKR